jgi:hypothetical protein
VERDGGVGAAAQDFAIEDDDCTDGDLAKGLGLAGQGQGFGHVVVVRHEFRI